MVTRKESLDNTIDSVCEISISIKQLINTIVRVDKINDIKTLNSKDVHTLECLFEMSKTLKFDLIEGNK
jgi:hypothetical protein